MVLDTDTYNETDDQFALVHALLSPERLAVEAVYAAPFHNARSDGPGHGMELSYQEILRLLQRLGRSADGFAFRGSSGYLGAGGQPVESEAVRDLAARGLASPDDQPLYVVAIGAITNVASALLTEPALAGKMVYCGRTTRSHDSGGLGGTQPYMLESLSVRTFKSLEDVTVDLGLVNVFIGANGSGKTNLLEALGVLSAAAYGEVDDQRLKSRGVRPGVPRLYKSAFPAKAGKKIPPHLFFGARSARAKYEVSLHNPLNEPAPAWRFKSELWEDLDGPLVSRFPATRGRTNPERGLAALESVRANGRDALYLLDLLRGYVIFTPTTSVLSSVNQDAQQREPLGLSGGRLPDAILELLKQRPKDEHSTRICRDVLALVDWADRIGVSRTTQLPLSPSVAATGTVIRFHDRYMRKDHNVLSGYDASEGALYTLFLAVISGHRNGPRLCAVDNADHGLNPRLARSLIEHTCAWYLDASEPRQILLTTHNPLVLDGLPLQDDRVRLFTVSRTSSGRTSVRRVTVDDDLLRKAKQGWTLSRLWVMGHLGGVPDV